MSRNVIRRDFLTSSVAGAGLVSLGKPVLAAKVEPKSGMPLRPFGRTGEMVSLLAFGGGNRTRVIVLFWLT